MITIMTLAEHFLVLDLLAESSAVVGSRPHLTFPFRSWSRTAFFTKCLPSTVNEEETLSQQLPTIMQ